MKNVICDIDGVLLQQNPLIPGADKFIHRLLEQGNPLVILTHYPSQTPRDLQNRLAGAGINVPQECLYTSAMATADFLKKQDGRKVFVVGEGALTHELYKIGFTITDVDPDYVIVGETRSYNWDMIRKASYLIMQGARFIGTNPDVAGPRGYPACGALCAPIERITGKQPLHGQAQSLDHAGGVEPHRCPFGKHDYCGGQSENRYSGRHPGRPGNGMGAHRCQPDARPGAGALSSQSYFSLCRGYRCRVRWGISLFAVPASSGRNRSFYATFSLL